jgi:hypothetical protein
MKRSGWWSSGHKHNGAKSFLKQQLIYVVPYTHTMLKYFIYVLKNCFPFYIFENTSLFIGWNSNLDLFLQDDIFAFSKSLLWFACTYIFTKHPFLFLFYFILSIFLLVVDFVTDSIMAKPYILQNFLLLWICWKFFALYHGHDFFDLRGHGGCWRLKTL